MHGKTSLSGDVDAPPYRNRRRIDFVLTCQSERAVYPTGFVELTASSEYANSLKLLLVSIGYSLLATSYACTRPVQHARCGSPRWWRDGHVLRQPKRSDLSVSTRDALRFRRLLVFAPGRRGLTDVDVIAVRGSIGVLAGARAGSGRDAALADAFQCRKDDAAPSGSGGKGRVGLPSRIPAAACSARAATPVFLDHPSARRQTLSCLAVRACGDSHRGRRIRSAYDHARGWGGPADSRAARTTFQPFARPVLRRDDGLSWVHRPDRTNTS